MRAMAAVPRRDEANAHISEALEAWIAALPDETEGQGIGVLGDWLAVVAMVNVDEQGDARVQYYVALKGGTMLPHIAEGLLRQGLRELTISDYREDS